MRVAIAGIRVEGEILHENLAEIQVMLGMGEKGGGTGFSEE